MGQRVKLFYATKQGWILLGLTIVYLILSAMYPVFNHPRPWTFYFGSLIDKWIPFTPPWILIYVVWYLYLPVVGLMVLFKNRHLYLRWILSFVLGISSCFVIYTIFQTTVPRPDVSGSDFFIRIVRMIYANDLPYNCFPSIHVVTSYICIIALSRLTDYHRNLKLGLIVLGWLISFSTLFVKQHVFADLVSGVLVAMIVYWVADRVGNWLQSTNPDAVMQGNH